MTHQSLYDLMIEGRRAQYGHRQSDFAFRVDIGGIPFETVYESGHVDGTPITEVPTPSHRVYVHGEEQLTDGMGPVTEPWETVSESIELMIGNADNPHGGPHELNGLDFHIQTDVDASTVTELLEYWDGRQSDSMDVGTIYSIDIPIGGTTILLEVEKTEELPDEADLFTASNWTRWVYLDDGRMISTDAFNRETVDSLLGDALSWVFGSVLRHTFRGNLSPSDVTLEDMLSTFEGYQV